MPYKLIKLYSLSILAGMLVSSPAMAYVGPGLGLTAIGSALALLGAVVLAVVGFFWYPLKRLFGGKKDQEDVDGDLEPEADSKN